MANTTATSPGTMANDATPLLDSYSESNDDGNTAEVYGTRRFGQTFSNGSSITLDSCKLYLKKYASAVDNCRVKIYAHTGTYGTNGVPTGAALATSDDSDASTFSTSKELVTFSFTGANRITLSADTDYVVVVEMPTAASYLYGLALGEDRTSLTASGNFVSSTDSGSNWSASTSIDVPFYIYGAVGNVAWTNPDNAKSSDDSYATIYAGDDNETIVDVNVKIVKSDGSIGSENKADVSTVWSESDEYVSYGSSTDLWSETWTPSDINDSDFGIAFSSENTQGSEINQYLKATNFGFSIPSDATINGILVEIEKKRFYAAGNYGVAYVDHIRITVYYAGTNAGTITGVQTIQGIQSITL